MTLLEAVRQTQQALASCPIDVPHLEAELLVMEALAQTNLEDYPPALQTSAYPGRAWLYARLQEELPEAAWGTLHRLLERRLGGEPLAYIRGHKEFFGLDFLVDRRVLIPRPETETLVEAALAWLRGWRGPWLAADVGTGCGAIAISLALNLPQLTVYATDTSANALEVAAANVQRHGVADRVRLAQGDLLDPLPSPVALIAANLPYISAADWPQLSPEVALFEPPQALDGGESGLRLIQRITGQAMSYLLPGGCLLLELGLGQGQAVLEQARAAFPQARIGLLPDLAGIPRVLRVEMEV